MKGELRGIRRETDSSGEKLNKKLYFSVKSFSPPSFSFVYFEILGNKGCMYSAPGDTEVYKNKYVK